MVNCSGLSSFNCYLAAQQPTFGHYQGDSLTHPMLITAFLQFQPEGHPELSKDGKKLKLDAVTTEKWLNDCSEKIPQSNNGKSIHSVFVKLDNHSSCRKFYACDMSKVTPERCSYGVCADNLCSKWFPGNSWTYFLLLEWL